MVRSLGSQFQKYQFRDRKRSIVQVGPSRSTQGQLAFVAVGKSLGHSLEMFFLDPASECGRDAKGIILFNTPSRRTIPNPQFYAKICLLGAALCALRSLGAVRITPGSF